MIPKFMVLVKLPNPNAYPSCPSGDTDYQVAYSHALAEARPDGFKYIYPRQNTKWPVDSEGWTWAQLRCSDEKVALAYWMSHAHQLEKRLAEIKERLEPIVRIVRS